jgi:long-chain acyl-CoA synthetase
MGLSELISRNEHLRFIDADSGTEFKSEDLYQDDFHKEHNKKLAFCYIDNSVASVSVLLSLFNSPHAFALLNPQLHPDFKTNLESIYTPSIIYDPSRSEIEHYTKKSNKTFSWFESETASKYSLAPELKMLLSTSGTTGSPRFVKLSEDNIIQNAKSIIDYLPISHEDTAPLMLPLYYSYGFSVFSTNCIKGGKIVCGVKDLMNKLFWEEFEKYGFTSLSGVPFFFEMLNRVGFIKKQYPGLKYMTQAGGKLNENLVSVFAGYAKQSGILFYVMYGQTEATARMSYLDPEYLEAKKGSIGKPILNGHFNIEAGTSELQYSGPNVFGGYADSPDDLSSFTQPVILKTGDTAIKDPEGFYYITGRIKRMVKIFGNRINLDEVEQVLKNQFPDSIFGCVGIKDKYLLVTTDNMALDSQKVLSFLSTYLEIHISAFKYSALDNMPVNANGKINYSVLTEQYGTV